MEEELRLEIETISEVWWLPSFFLDFIDNSSLASSNT